MDRATTAGFRGTRYQKTTLPPPLSVFARALISRSAMSGWGAPSGQAAALHGQAAGRILGLSFSALAVHRCVGQTRRPLFRSLAALMSASS